MMQKSLTTSFHKDPSTLDPRKSGDAISSAAIFLLFRGLTKLQPNHEITFDIAESFQISRDEKRYVFYLGENYWSDGKPITAQDFVTSWKAVLKPAFPALSAHLFYSIKNAQAAKKGDKPLEKVGLHAEGTKKLLIELEHPVPNFLEIISFCNFFPVPSHFEDPLRNETFACSGPFQLVKWSHGKELLFKKNQQYKQAFSIFFESILIRIIADPKEAFNLFASGELDWVGEPYSPLPVNHLPALEQEWKSQSIGGVSLCFFNCQQFPFSNRNLRRAFSYAINRKKILRKLYLPNATPAMGLVPPIFKKNKTSDFFTDEEGEIAQKYFQKGIEEIGKGGEKLCWKLSFEASEINFQIAKSLKRDWEETFSIKIHLEPLEFKIFYDRLSKREYLISFTEWIAQYNHPMNLLERLKNPESGKNFAGWSDKEYSRLLERYLKDGDENRKLDLIEQAEQFLIQQMPIAPLYFFSYSYLQKPDLKNLFYSPIGRVYIEHASFPKSQTQSEFYEADRHARSSHI
jgi:oligopeptide transport system substrate-binding protein